MRLRAEQLPRHLGETVAPVYLLSGDEPLLLNEAADAIRKAAHAAGHDNREVMQAGSGFDWNALLTEAASLSLFAGKKLIDLRIPSGKPGREGGKVLIEYCADPPPDTVLLLILPKIDRQQLASKWFKAIERVGVTVQVWPVEHTQLPRWIEQRLRQAGIQPSRDAVQLLAERVEGNLLAANQEIEKLLLLHGEGPLDAGALTDAVADSARYDVFDLADAALNGELARCLHILEGLQGEDIAAPVVLWALHRTISQLAGLAVASAQGRNIDQAMTKAGVWDKRKPLLRRAVTRLKPAQWLALLNDCQAADAAAKGADPRDPWLLFEQIVSRIAA